MRRLVLARAYGSTIVGVAAVTAIIGALERRGHIANISMLYLIVVLAAATFGGRRVAIVASLGSFLAYNWFFVAPTHTLTVGDPEEWFALGLFLVTAAITSQLAAGMRDRAREAAERERETVHLYQERERLRERATEAEVLRRADDLKTALLGAVSHDLRTPLASIIASAASLRQPDVEWTAAERDGFLADIEQEAKRLARIVANLLDLSRISSGTLHPERGWYDLAALVDDVLGRLRPLLAARTVEVRIPDDLPPVPLDYVEIDQVLSNIVENAVRHTPKATHMWIEVTHDDDDVTVRVSDDGPGIPEDVRARLFEPFVRGGDRRLAARGAGLGLAVARALVVAHGGTIEAEPRGGGGTSVWFRLPLRTAVAVGS